MDYQSIAKEAALAILGEVEELVRNDDVAWRITFPLGTDRAHADDFIDTKHFDSPNVGPIIYLSRAVYVTNTKPCLEGQFFPMNRTGHHG